jgi:hypothetical protein
MLALRCCRMMLSHANLPFVIYKRKACQKACLTTTMVVGVGTALQADDDVARQSTFVIMNEK